MKMWQWQILLGAQFGTVISMPLSGLLAVSYAGWPSIFYVFGAIGTVWCVAFLYWIYEDPEVNPKIHPEERMYIQKTLGRVAGQTVCNRFFMIFLNIETVFFLADSCHSMDVNIEIFAILGYPISPYGSQLRLRDFNDRTANLHETSVAFLYQRCKFQV